MQVKRTSTVLSANCLWSPLPVNLAESVVASTQMMLRDIIRKSNILPLWVNLNEYNKRVLDGTSPTERPLNISTQTERPLDVSSTVTLRTHDILTPIHKVPGFDAHPYHGVDIMSLVTSCPASFTLFVTFKP
jgi:hypothetical protein